MLVDNCELIHRVNTPRSRRVLILAGGIAREDLFAVAAVLIALLALYPAFAESNGASTLGSIDPAQLEEFVDGTVGAAMREDEIAGVAVAIVDAMKQHKSDRPVGFING